MIGLDKTYIQFDKASKTLSAYAVLKDGQFIGRVVFKHGQMRTYCYAQVWGAPMARGSANGYGYDKSSAACEAAVAKLFIGANPPTSNAHVEAWKVAVTPQSGGLNWQRRLEDAGYTICGVV